MNLYPEQLRAVTSMCEALNALDKALEENDRNSDVPSRLMLKSRIPVISSEPGDEYGYLVDEVGGAWSFEPYTKPEGAEQS